MPAPSTTASVRAMMVLSQQNDAGPADRTDESGTEYRNDPRRAAGTKVVNGVHNADDHRCIAAAAGAC